MHCLNLSWDKENREFVFYLATLWVFWTSLLCLKWQIMSWGSSLSHESNTSNGLQIGVEITELWLKEGCMSYWLRIIIEKEWSNNFPVWLILFPLNLMQTIFISHLRHDISWVWKHIGAYLSISYVWKVERYQDISEGTNLAILGSFECWSYWRL